jgi:hypothetical protein
MLKLCHFLQKIARVMVVNNRQSSQNLRFGFGFDFLLDERFAD